MNFEQLFSRLKSATAALTAGQVMSLALAFVAVVGLTIGSAYYLNTPNYSILFADMEPDAASSIVTKLKNDKVQYVLDQGGRTVRVPATRVDELRMQYASDGLSSSTGGYYLFDRTNFGATEFVEQINYRRALEGELARTIGSIGEVSSARVHIALPQRSVFTDRDQTTKASVILKLRSNRRLPAATVDGITNLVAASVESLRPESVVIMDTFGRPLSTPEPGDDPVANQHLERQQRIERDLVAKVVAMVSPVVGEGHVRANVSVKLDGASEETVEDVYDPDPVVRSKQVISAGSTGATAGMLAPPSTLAPLQGGVAGTRANLPVSPAQAGGAGAAETTVALAPTPASTTNTSESTNYEVGHKNTHRIAPAGDIAKLSVAVLVDGDRPASADGSTPAKTLDVQKIQGLVSAAVGFDADRGDLITVENIPFEETPSEEMISPGAWQKYGPQAFEALRIIGIVTLAALALFIVIRPMVSGALAAVPAGPQSAALARRAAVVAAVANAGPGPRTVQDIEAEMDAQLEATDAQRLPVLTKRMAALTQKEPENAAKLLRTWLAEGK